jgi:predicted unusual protein kinase regulating ubiquinone biosynthesis (AarF/ABC1/UbiB family)
VATGEGITTGRVARALPLAGLAARTAGESVLRTLRRRELGPEDYVARAERYVELLGRSKGALMKAGQILSFVPFGSSVPAENRAAFQAAMSRLQADAPPMAPALAAQVIEAELGGRPEKVFAAFSPTPVAAASIGQVHRARLADGREVAVKVQYPGVADAIGADLRNTELVAVLFQLLRSVVPGLSRLDLRAVAAEVTERISEELDYRTEAANQSYFAEAYQDHPFIRVPAIHLEYSSARVLTQDWAEGVDFASAVGAPQELRDSWSEAIFRFVFGSLRRLCAFNADPHPGNYRFSDDGTVWFLDFGCVKHFSRAQVSLMQDMIRAVVAADAERLWSVFVELGMLEASSGLSPAEVLEWWAPGLEMLTGPQPYQLEPDHVARVIEHEFSPVGDSGRLVRRMNAPKDWVFMSRIDMGLMSVLAELGATGSWASIQREMDDGAPAQTELGRLEAKYWAARGPVGLAEL